jgi:hypothetical protein
MEFFRCPSCNEMIAVSATECRFCGCPQTAESTEKAIRHQREVEAAVRESINIKFVGWGAAVIAGLQAYFCILADGVPLKFFALLQVVAPLACVVSWRWVYKYGGLITKEPDFPEAVKAVKRAAVIWSLTVGVQLPLLVFLLFKIYADKVQQA